jgi:type I restriction enzyme M protein
VYDYRTNIYHTLKKNPLKPEDLQDFITCYNPTNRHRRTATYNEQNVEDRWRCFTYDEIIKAKTSLEIT